jgi:hypothetical protein
MSCIAALIICGVMSASFSVGQTLAHARACDAVVRFVATSPGEVHSVA